MVMIYSDAERTDGQVKRMHRRQNEDETEHQGLCKAFNIL